MCGWARGVTGPSLSTPHGAPGERTLLPALTLPLDDGADLFSLSLSYCFPTYFTIFEDILKETYFLLLCDVIW